MASLYKFRGEDEVLHDRTPTDEPSLVDIDDVADLGMQPGGDDFGEHFHRAVLKGHGPKCIQLVSARLLGQEHDEHPVDAIQVQPIEVEAVVEQHDVVANSRPCRLVETGADFVRAFVQHVKEEDQKGAVV